MTTETVTLPDPPPVDPAVAAAANPPPADPPAPVDPALETPPAPAVADAPPADSGEPKPHGNKGRKPWYLDRISEESEARRQAEERARNAEALLERSQQRPPADPAAPPAAPRADESAVEARARQIAEDRLANDKIQSVIRAGIAKFGDWDQRAEMLGAVGAATPAFVLDVVSVDPQNAHLILHQLADDPQRAAHLAKMDTRSRTIELVKMSMAASQTETKPAAPTGEQKPPAPPKAVSKAPPPPPPVEPGAAQSIDWRSDKASDQEFSRGWEENMRKRHSRR